MINVPYHLSYRLARARRWFYTSRLASYAQAPLPPGPELPFRVVSLSGMRDLAEQVASWRSLLQHLGQPQEFLLVSDGTHTEEAKAILHSLHPRVRITVWRDYLTAAAPDCVHRYARTNPMGMKLSAFMGLPQFAPLLYCDSDILFFPGIAHFRDYFRATPPDVLYLPDCAPSFDKHLLQSPEEFQNPVNAGFLYLNRAISLDKGLSRFANPDHPNSFFSEQTIVHLAVHEAKGQALPADRYIMRSEDQWSPTDAYASRPGVAMRHYISSIRYKMWHQIPLL
ncbi:MAG: hypothetical protein OHK0021_21590 [Bryobacter sp.]